MNSLTRSSPEAGLVADVVEEDGGPQGAQLGDTGGEAVRGRAHLRREQLACGRNVQR